MNFQLKVISQEFAGSDSGGHPLVRVGFQLLPGAGFGSDVPAGVVQLVILQSLANSVDIGDTVNVTIAKV